MVISRTKNTKNPRKQPSYSYLTVSQQKKTHFEVFLPIKTTAKLNNTALESKNSEINEDLGLLKEEHKTSLFELPSGIKHFQEYSSQRND
jgi:hypothetical protein